VVVSQRFPAGTELRRTAFLVTVGSTTPIGSTLDVGSDLTGT